MKNPLKLASVLQWSISYIYNSRSFVLPSSWHSLLMIFGSHTLNYFPISSLQQCLLFTLTRFTPQATWISTRKEYKSFHTTLPAAFWLIMTFTLHKELSPCEYNETNHVSRRNWPTASSNSLETPIMLHWLRSRLATTARLQLKQPAWMCIARACKLQWSQ
jgi:hypothetical protein